MKLLIKPKVTCAWATLTCLTIASCSQVVTPENNDEATELVSLATEQDKKQVVAPYWPVLDISVAQEKSVEDKVDKLMSTMTLAQKIAQMIQPEIRDISIEDMREYGFGSYLNGGGSFPENNKHATPNDWIKLAEEMYQASIDDSVDGSTIPTMWGTDAVHGHNNVIGATLFPHNIGLGATRNPKLIEQVAKFTAREVMVTGIDWVFAPTVAVVRDDRWGRTYEGYSEDPEIVKSYSAAIVKGLQGSVDEDFLGDEQVISTVKHFLGDGGTIDGDDQGDNIASEKQLFDIHAQGYLGGLSAGAQSVMASFNSWHGVKNHGNKYLLNDILKERMGFDGFVVGDWNGHGQVKGCSNESCPQAINAGLDIFMVPTKAWKPLYENTIAQVKRGEISQSRIDDAVRRILRVKVRAGLFEKPSPAQRTFSGKTELIGAKAHRDVARQAVRESLVLLKNNEQLLPLSPKQRILVAGDGADNIGKQSGGWSISWQGTGNNNDDFPGGTSIYDGIAATVHNAGGEVELNEEGIFTQKPDVAIVVFGEEPYAEGHGDIDNLAYQRGVQKDLALLKRLKKQGIAVVSVFISGRPMWVNAELNASDAFVAAWLPGSEGAGIAEVIFSKEGGEINYDFTGKLSFSWPAHSQQYVVNRFDTDYQPLLPYGFGLQYGQLSTLSDQLSEVSSSIDNSLHNLVMYQGAAKKPWSSFISAEDSPIAINSSVQSIPGISFQTIDKVVQEDAFILTYSGSKTATFSLTSNFPEDLRGYFEADASLTFSYRVNEKPSALTHLTMECEGNCSGSLDMKTMFSTAPIGKWQTHSIDLKCFANAGVDMAKVTTPFSIETNGTLQLSLADITISANDNTSAMQSCN